MGEPCWTRSPGVDAQIEGDNLDVPWPLSLPRSRAHDQSSLHAGQGPTGFKVKRHQLTLVCYSHA